MAKNTIRIFLLVVALLIGPNSVVGAAVIQNSNNKLCAFSLEGPITQGDSDRLSAAVSRGRIDQYDEGTSSVCLKSNGGSYGEGLGMGELIYNPGLVTCIDYGFEGYSASPHIF